MIMDDIASILRGRSPKALARLAQVHPRTAARWQADETRPGADDLVRMMAAHAGIFAQIACLAGHADAASHALAAQHIQRALAALDAP